MKAVERYARLVARRPGLLIAVLMLFTFVSLFGMSLVRTQGMSYRDMLPQNIKEIKAINYIGDEFGTSGESIILAISTGPGVSGSDEARDVRNPDVMAYADILEQKIRMVQGVSSVTGAPDYLRLLNSGRIPKTRAGITEVMKKGITINSTSFDITDMLSQFSEGLSGIEQGLDAQSQILGGLTQGLNGSSVGLKQMSAALATIVQSMGSTGDMSQAQDAISLIDAIEGLVQQSSATMSEKMQITGYLEGLKQGLNAMISEASEAQEGMSYLSQSLQGISAGIERVSSGLQEMSNTTAMLGNMTSGLRLEEASTYAKLYQGEKNKDNKPRQINPFSRYISNDYTTTVIRISISELSDKDKENVVKEIRDIIGETERPAGLSIGLTGDPIVSEELRNQVLPTMKTTSMFSLIGIFLVVCLLFLSLRYGVISLLAIAFGVIWVYGVLGLAGLSITSTTSGAISMIMGIGIDFGIQVVNRFRQELKDGIENAAVVTLSNVFTPMSITTLAALIGFRAMSLGKITLLSELGNIMSLGVLFCFIAAMTLIPSILVITERFRRKKPS